MEIFKLFGSIVVESADAEKNIQNLIEKAKKIKSELSDITIVIDATDAMKQIQAVIDKLAVLKNPVSLGTISANNTNALNALNALIVKIDKLDDQIDLGSVSIDTSSVLTNIQKVMDKIEQIQYMVRLMNSTSYGGSYGAYSSYYGMQGNYGLLGNGATNYISSYGNVVWDLDSGSFVNTSSTNADGNNVTPIEDEATPEQIARRNSNAVFWGNMKTQFANYLGNAAVDFTKSGREHLMAMDAYGKMLETYMHTDEKTALAMRDQLQKVAEDTPFSMETVMDQAVMLLATGTKPEDLISTINMLGDISGGNSTMFGRIATAYWQIMTDNILYSQDANQLTEAGVPIWEWVADYFNEIGRNPFDDTATDEKYKGWWDVYKVRNLAAAAKAPNEQLYGSKELTDAVTSDEITEIFMRQVSEGGERYNAMGNYMESGPGQLERLKDETTQLSAAILKPIYELMTNGGFEVLTDAMIKLADIINRVYDAIGGDLEEFKKRVGIVGAEEAEEQGYLPADGKGMAKLNAAEKNAGFFDRVKMYWYALTGNEEALEALVNEPNGSDIRPDGPPSGGGGRRFDDTPSDGTGDPLPDGWVPSGAAFDSLKPGALISDLIAAVREQTAAFSFAELKSAVSSASKEGVVTGMAGVKIEQGNVILYPGTIVGALTPLLNMKLGTQVARDERNV